MLKVTRRPDGVYQKVAVKSEFEDALKQEILLQVSEAISAEQTERQSQDALLSQRIGTVESGLQTEKTERQAYDDGILRRVAELEAKVGTGTGGSSIPPDLDAQLQEISAGLASLKSKTFLVPIEEISNDGSLPAKPIAVTTNSYKLKYSGPGQIFPGPVDVLNEAGDMPMIGPDGKEIIATVDSSGVVIFSRAPNAVVRLTFGVLMPFSSLPQEFLKVRFKSGLEKDIGLFLDVAGLKEDMAIEKITPSGLYAQATGSTVYLTFTYQDRPELSHFILERYNPTTGQWEPYDGQQGIVTK